MEIYNKNSPVENHAVSENAVQQTVDNQEKKSKIAEVSIEALQMKEAKRIRLTERQIESSGGECSLTDHFETVLNLDSAEATKQQQIINGLIEEWRSGKRISSIDVLPLAEFNDTEILDILLAFTSQIVPVLDQQLPFLADVVKKLNVLLPGSGVPRLSDQIFFDRINPASAEGQQMRIAFAKLAAGQPVPLFHSGGISRRIKQYAIQDLNERIKIAKIAAAAPNDIDSLFRRIKDYDIDFQTEAGQNALFEVAMNAAQQYANAVCYHMREFPINRGTALGQQNLFKIAMLAAAKDPHALCVHLYSFGLHQESPEGKRALFEIAMQAAQSNGAALSEGIGLFGFDPNIEEDFNRLVDIATCAATYGTNIGAFDYLFKYGIEPNSEFGQAFYLKIALLEAAKNPGCAWNVLNSAQFLTINFISSEGQAALFKIGAQASHAEPLEAFYALLYRGFRPYKLDEQQYSIWLEIVKSAASHATENKSVAKVIQCCAIKNQTDRITIAKLEAYAAPYHLGEIRSYEIDPETAEGQAALVEIATLEVPSETSYAQRARAKAIAMNIQKFGIKDSKIRSKIALRIAQYNAIISMSIPSFNLDDQKVLVEIAKRAARINGSETLTWLYQYGLMESDDLALIYLEALIENPKCHKNLSEGKMENLPSSFLHALFSAKEVEKCPVLAEQCLEDMYKRGLNLETKQLLTEQAHQIKTRNDRKVFLKDLLAVFTIMEHCRRDQIPFTEVASVVFDCLKLYRPTWRQEVAEIINLHLSSEPVTLKRQGHFRAIAQELHSSLILPIYLISSLEQPKMSHLDSFVKILAAKKTQLKDNVFQNALIPALLVLNHDDRLPALQKINILKEALNAATKADSIALLGAISSLAYLNGDLQVFASGEITAEKINAELKAAFFRKIPLESIEGFASKFESTLKQFRDPQAIFTYAARLNTLPANESQMLLKKLGEFAQSVLEGQFYALKNSRTEHLDAVFLNRPELEEKWKKGASMPLSQNISTTEGTTDEIRFEKIIQSWLDNQHAAGYDLTFLTNYLSKSGEERDQIYEELNTFVQTLPRDDERRTNLFLQKNLIDLTKTSNIPKAIGILKNCRKFVPSGLPKQFQADLQDLEDILQKKQSEQTESFQGWRLEDSIDPCDLLLSGTEVKGSCQRVDGSPELNKSLLGYLLDGKNRLLVIKDQEGVIQARSILRILIDQNDQPVLFMEQIYPELLDARLAESLIAFAIKRAEDLGLMLVSKNIETTEESKLTLRSLSGAAPFEYVDANKGVFMDEEWSLTGGHVLYKPTR